MIRKLALPTPELEEIFDEGVEDPVLTPTQSTSTESPDDFAAIQQQKQELSDLLDVRKIIHYRRRLPALENRIREVYNKQYQTDFSSLGAFGFFVGLIGAGTAWWHIIDYVPKTEDHSEYFLAGTTSLLIGIIGFALGNYFPSRSKEKKFEEEKEAKLEKLDQEKKDLEHKLSLYETESATIGSIVLFTAHTGYSLGYIQSKEVEQINVKQSGYKEEKTKIEGTIHELQPGDFYVLTPDHELSPDDVKVVQAGTPLILNGDNTSFPKFGFAKIEENKLNLYTDAQCTFLSYICPEEELRTATIKKLVPKLKETIPHSPYR